MIHVGVPVGSRVVYETVAHAEDDARRRNGNQTIVQLKHSSQVMGWEDADASDQE